jgi:hypothetical protein
VWRVEPFGGFVSWFSLSTYLNIKDSLCVCVSLVSAVAGIPNKEV